MKLNIPFYENSGDGNQCLQVTMQSALKHFLNKDFSLTELDKLTKRKPNMWTWCSQIVTVLYDLGLDVKYYSKTQQLNFLDGEKYIRENYTKENADFIVKMTDIPVLVESIKKMQKYNVFENKKLSFKEIENHINKNHVVLIMIDENVLNGIKKPYYGHFVVLTGYDNENVYYHESGPNNTSPNRKVKKQKFIDAWNANGTDNDVIIVLGKR